MTKYNLFYIIQKKCKGEKMKNIFFIFGLVFVFFFSGCENVESQINSCEINTTEEKMIKKVDPEDFGFEKKGRAFCDQNKSFWCGDEESDFITNMQDDLAEYFDEAAEGGLIEMAKKLKGVFQYEKDPKTGDVWSFLRFKKGPILLGDCEDIEITLYDLLVFYDIVPREDIKVMTGFVYDCQMKKPVGHGWLQIYYKGKEYLFDTSGIHEMSEYLKKKYNGVAVDMPLYWERWSKPSTSSKKL